MAASDILKLQVLLGLGDSFSGPAKRISKSSQEAFGKIRELGKQLKTLQGTADDVGKFRELKRGLPATAREARQTRARLHELQQQLAATTKPSRALTRQLKSLTKQSASLDARQAAQVQQLHALRTAMRGAGVNTRSLRTEERRLQGDIEQTTAAIKAQQEQLAIAARREKRLGELRDRFHRSQQTAANMSVGGYAAQTVGRATLGPIIGALTQGARFQASLRDQAITGEMSAAQEQGLGRVVRQQSKRWGLGTDEVFGASGALVSAGIASPEALRQYIPLLSKARVATNAQMQDLGQLFVSLDQQLHVKDMAGTLDALAKAGKEGNFELKDMARWMPKLGGGIASMGQYGKGAAATLGAALQIVRRGAGDADEAGNNLANYLKGITAQVTKTNFAKVGIDYEKRITQLQAQGIGPLEGSLRIVQEYLDKRGATAAFRQLGDIKDADLRKQQTQQLSKRFGLAEVFNDQQAVNAILPLLSNMDDFRKIRADAMGAKGTIDIDAAKRMQTMAKQWDKAKANALDLAITVSNVLAPAVIKLLKWATRLAERLGQWTKTHPKLTAAILKTAAAFGAFMFVAGGFAILVASLLSPFALLRYAFGRVGLTSARAGRVMRGLWRAIKGGAGILRVAGGRLLRFAKLVRGAAWRGVRKLTGQIGRLGIQAARVASRGMLKLGGQIGRLAVMAGGGAWRGVLKLAGGIKLVGRAVLWLGRALLANPILLALAGIAWAAYHIYKNWDSFSGFFIDLWNSILRALKPVTDTIIAVWDAVKLAVTDTIEWIAGKIDWIIKKWEKLTGLVKKINATATKVGNAAVKVLADKHQSFGKRVAAGAFLTTALMATGGIGSTIINVHASPGMDEKKIAAHTVKQLDARDRERAARARSQMRDRE